MMDLQTLHRRVAAFPRWHYQFDLPGMQTPIHDPAWINRHDQRRRYFFEPLVRLLGGSLAGRRVLDLGCNAGFWSLQAIRAGCEQVVGIDGRATHIDQARLIFEAEEVEPARYRFLHANLFDLDPAELGSFEVVLCLGLLYHTCKPMALLEWIGRLNTDLLLIDTNLCQHPGSAVEFLPEPLDEPRNACDYGLVGFPSRRAVRDLVRVLGYRSVVLRPEFSDWTGSEDFRTGRRRAFLCARQTDLSALVDEPDPPGVPPISPALETQPTGALVRALLRKLLRPWRR